MMLPGANTGLKTCSVDDCRCAVQALLGTLTVTVNLYPNCPFRAFLYHSVSKDVCFHISMWVYPCYSDFPALHSRRQVHAAYSCICGETFLESFGCFDHQPKHLKACQMPKRELATSSLCRVLSGVQLGSTPIHSNVPSPSTYIYSGLGHQQ